MSSLRSIAGRRRLRGFTLLEALIVLLILSILVTIGLPSLRDLIASGHVRGAASDLYGSMILARSEAIKRNASVDLIPNVATNWGAGWTVRVAGTVEDLMVREPVPAEVAVNGPGSSIRYRGDGRLVDPATGTLFAAEVAFRFLASNYAHIPLRCIGVDPSGRPSVRTDTDFDSANGCN